MCRHLGNPTLIHSTSLRFLCNPHPRNKYGGKLRENPAKLNNLIEDGARFCRLSKTVQRPIRGTVVDFRSADQYWAPGTDQATPGVAASDVQAGTARACHGTHLRCVHLQGLLPAVFDVVLSTNILDAYRRIIDASTLRAITVRTTATEADGRSHSAAKMNVPRRLFYGFS